MKLEIIKKCTDEFLIYELSESTKKRFRERLEKAEFRKLLPFQTIGIRLCEILLLPVAEFEIYDVPYQLAKLSKEQLKEIGFTKAVYNNGPEIEF